MWENQKSGEKRVMLLPFINDEREEVVTVCELVFHQEAIQVLCNTVGGGGGGGKFPGKSIRKVYGSMLLVLRGGGWVSIFQKKCYVTLLNGPQALSVK